MDSIELMIDEHKYIKRMLEVLRGHCVNILNGKQVDFEAFAKAIDFIRNYADKHHHSKEEIVLLKDMIEKLDPKINREPINGMFIEHDYGRYFIGNLEDALNRVKNGDDESKVDIIANAISYTDLLKRHIHKEDNALFIFARKNLNEEVLQDIDRRCEDIEREAAQKHIQDKYTKMVDELEESLR